MCVYVCALEGVIGRIETVLANCVYVCVAQNVHSSISGLGKTCLGSFGAR